MPWLALLLVMLALAAIPALTADPRSGHEDDAQKGTL